MYHITFMNIIIDDLTTCALCEINMRSLEVSVSAPRLRGRWFEAC